MPRLPRPARLASRRQRPALGVPRHPFSKELEDAALWLPAAKQALVDALTEALHARESVLLTGDPGVGKTCVLRALRHQLPAVGFRLTYCHNATRRRAHPARGGSGVGGPRPPDDAW